MEFKEAIKTRKRMCCHYRKCNDCPLFTFADGCIDAMIELRKLDEYERILEEWAKEHPVMTNADKYKEVMKNTFGGDVGKGEIMEICISNLLGIECIERCEECLKWWDEEYKEPEKEKNE